MKILGVILTWNNFEFFKRALKQALSFCDEVIVAEGCHMDGYPKRSTDGTCEYLEKMKGTDKLVIIDDFKFKGKNNRVQFKIRNTYSRASSLWKPDNWIVQWDDDMFFFDNDLKNLKDIMKTTKHDTIMFRERRFAYNFRFNLLASKNDLYGHKFQKIKKGCYYTPNWKLRYKNGKFYSDILNLSDITYFHYPFVKKTDRAKFRWDISIEKGHKKHKKTKRLWDGFKYKKDKDIFKQEKNFRRIIGGKGVLNVHVGKHPEVLEDHPFRFIDDVRKIK